MKHNLNKIIFSFAAALALVLAFQNCGSKNQSQSQPNNQITNTGTNSDSSVCNPPHCAAPPINCRYVNPTLDANNCPTDCGQLKCDLNDPNLCPDLPQCAAPPINCRYTDIPIDENQCITGCGKLVCDRELIPAPSKNKN